MKNLFFVLLILPATIPAEFSLADITRAISAGDVAALSSYFDESVEVSILDKEDVYSKSEATKIVNSFFAKYKPQSFSQVHNGTNEKSNSQYSIGNLVCTGGSFTVYIYLKNTGSKVLIQELRFDPE